MNKAKLIHFRTWHSYVPASDSFTYLMARVHWLLSVEWWTAKRRSLVYLSKPDVKMCQSLRRTQETCSNNATYLRPKVSRQYKCKEIGVAITTDYGKLAGMVEASKTRKYFLKLLACQ